MDDDEKEERRESMARAVFWIGLGILVFALIVTVPCVIGALMWGRKR
jgi:hypothetical protein